MSGHETRDVNVRAVLWLAIGVVVVGLFVQGALWLLGRQLETEAARGDPALSPLARSASPPPPHLQQSPSRELAEFQESQNRWLNSYGWIDKKAGIVRIPVSRAMDLVAERGLQPAGKPSTKK